MTKRSTILYWLLLLVPSLFIGSAASVLICREQDRINQQARTAAVDGARVLAENIKLSVVAVEESVTEGLVGIDRRDLGGALAAWEQTSPLIRNSFMWHPQQGLQVPLLGDHSSVEDRLFVARYATLFTGRVPWERDSEEIGNPDPNSYSQSLSAQQPPNAAPTQQAIAQKDNNWSSWQTRKRIRNVARAQQQMPAQQGKRGSRPAQPEVRSGWKPWYADEHLYMLGWAQAEPDGLIYGVEIEMMWLLSQLIADLPAEAPSKLVYALLDGSGQVFHQVGPTVLEDDAQPEFLIPLSPCLPHWQVAVYFVHGGPMVATSTSFVVLWGFVLFIFMTTIFVGGYLLTRQAHRNMIDAQQKTSFVSNVSHELKTPLTSIRMYAELMSEKRVEDPAKIDRYLGVIVSESQRLTRLVNNVLDFGRLEQGRKKYQLGELDLVQLLKDIVESHRLRVEAAGMQLNAVIPAREVTIVADRDALEQAVLNLIDNAIKYAANGRDLDIRLDPESRGCNIRVQDRGPGVPLGQREAIFEKFHRVDDSLTATKPGSGLGLSIARRLVRDLGGDLAYEPRDGGGSCFVLTLRRSG